MQVQESGFFPFLNQKKGNQHDGLEGYKVVLYEEMRPKALSDKACLKQMSLVDERKTKVNRGKR